MRLNLTKDNPVVWASTHHGDWTVRRSPRPDDEGYRAYYVRGGGRSLVIRARWIKHFLAELAERLGVAYITLHASKDDPEGEHIWIGSKSRSKAA